MAEETQGGSTGGSASESKVAELEKRNAALQSQVENAQGLINKWSGELGESRKEVKDALAQIQEAVSGSGGTPKELLDRIAALEENAKSKETQSPTTGGQTAGTVEEVRASLSPEQLQAADAVWKKLPPEQKEAIYRDQEKMKTFLETAKEVPTAVPDSLLGGTAQSGESSFANDAKKMFGLADKEANGVPATGRGAPSGFAGADGTKSGKSQDDLEFPRLAQGKIPRPAGAAS